MGHRVPPPGVPSGGALRATPPGTPSERPLRPRPPGASSGHALWAHPAGHTEFAPGGVQGRITLFNWKPLRDWSGRSETQASARVAELDTLQALL